MKIQSAAMQLSSAYQSVERERAELHLQQETRDGRRSEQSLVVEQERLRAGVAGLRAGYEGRALQLPGALAEWGRAPESGTYGPGWDRSAGGGLGLGRPSLPPGLADRGVDVRESGPEVAVPPGAAKIESEEVEQSEVPLEGRFALLVAFVEAVSGRKVTVINPESLRSANAAPNIDAVSGDAASSAGDAPEVRGGTALSWSVERFRHAEVSFSAAGVVQTADGRRVEFALELSMSQTAVEVFGGEVRTGSLKVKDPLVVNLDGSPVAFSGGRMQFDIDADGETESMPLLAAGKGWLVQDLDGSGAIEDGREVLGASSGDAFADLRQLDADRNGWLDENDAAFQRLRIWQVTADAEGQPQGKLIGLLDAGVGALYLQPVATPMTMEQGGQAVAQLGQTGVFLFENGGAGSLQKVDVVV